MPEPACFIGPAVLEFLQLGRRITQGLVIYCCCCTAAAICRHCCRSRRAHGRLLWAKATTQKKRQRGTECHLHYNKNHHIPIFLAPDRFPLGALRLWSGLDLDVSLLLDWISESRRYSASSIRNLQSASTYTTHALDSLLAIESVRKSLCNIRYHTYAFSSALARSSFVSVVSREEFAVYDGRVERAECDLLIPYFYTCFCLGCCKTAKITFRRII